VPPFLLTLSLDNEEQADRENMPPSLGVCFFFKMLVQLPSQTFAKFSLRAFLSARNRMAQVAAWLLSLLPFWFSVPFE